MNELKNKRILVIIVTYNAMRWVDNCLNSLLKSTIPLSTIVIDNNSQDNTVKHIKNNFPEIKLIQNSTNLGFGKANNLGLNFAIEQNFDYVFLLNQDAWIYNNTIEKLVEIHLTYTQLGILSPVQLNGKGDKIDKQFSTYIPYKTLHEIKKVNTHNRPFIETSFINAAAWLISRDCIMTTGGFDPIFSHYGEDQDYCYRAHYHSYRIGVALNATICHDRIYSKNNQYRKIPNRLLASGLAHLKNINNNLPLSYLSLVIQRSIKMAKAMFLLNINSFFFEVIVLVKLLLLYKTIKRNREICILSTTAFLTQSSS